MSRVDQGAAFAASSILPEVIDKEIRTRYRQLPIMVRMSGLAATYAFLLAKSDPNTSLGVAYRRVATGIRESLTGGSQAVVSELGVDPAVVGPARANEALLARLAALSPREYTRAASQVEVLSDWLSRLADARWQAQQ